MADAKVTDRFLAYLVDAVPFGLGYGVVGRPWLWVGLYVLYHSVGNAAGGTIGKRMLGLRVVRLDGTPLGAARSLARALGALLSTPLLNLGYLWALVRPDSRTWHDLLAGSRVVEAGPKSGARHVANALLALLLSAAVLGAGAWLHLLRPARADLEALSRAREGLGILARIEEAYKAGHGAYTDSLAELALASGDPALFREGLAGVFDERGFRLAATRDRYFISARARDRKRTTVRLEGP